MRIKYPSPVAAIYRARAWVSPLLAVGLMVASGEAEAASFVPVAGGVSIRMTGEIVGDDAQRLRQAVSTQTGRGIKERGRGLRVEGHYNDASSHHAAVWSPG